MKFDCIVIIVRSKFFVIVREIVVLVVERSILISGKGGLEGDWG